MDQKHAMLYPDTTDMPRDQRSSAAAAIGLPVEAPPSYDMATREPMAQPHIGWSASAPDVTPRTSNYSPAGHSNHHQSNLPVIAEQPRYPSHPASVSPNPSTYPPVQTYGTQQQPQQPRQEAAATITVQPAFIASLGPNPSKVTCPACGSSKVSRMCYTPNTRTHLCAFVLCLVGWCCCACIVPYCMNSCRTGNHYCAKCNAFLGAYNPRNIF